jgi:PAX-interacting protein 1
MKPRLVACVALVSLAIGAVALSSRIALAQAQGGRGSQGQQSDQDRSGQGGQLSDQIDKALQAYEERMDKNLDQCRKELDQMKKELHELIDLRINMALSLAELRAKAQMQGGGAGGGVYASQRPVAEGSGYRTVGGGGQGRGDGEGLSRELQQIHNQLRSEIDQQQGQVAQLASQLRGLQVQGQAGQQPGQGQGQRQGQGQGQGQNQGQGQGQNQGQGQAGQGQGQGQGQGPGGSRGQGRGPRGPGRQPPG